MACAFFHCTLFVMVWFGCVDQGDSDAHSVGASIHKYHFWCFDFGISGADHFEDLILFIRLAVIYSTIDILQVWKIKETGTVRTGMVKYLISKNLTISQCFCTAYFHKDHVNKQFRVKLPEALFLINHEDQYVLF